MLNLYHNETKELPEKNKMNRYKGHRNRESISAFFFTANITALRSCSNDASWKVKSFLCFLFSLLDKPSASRRINLVSIFIFKHFPNKNQMFSTKREPKKRRQVAFISMATLKFYEFQRFIHERHESYLSIWNARFECIRSRTGISNE